MRITTLGTVAFLMLASSPITHAQQCMSRDNDGNQVLVPCKDGMAPNSPESKSGKLAFPLPIVLGTTTVILNADGTAVGDGADFRKTLSELKGDFTQVQLVLLWSIARALPQ